MPSRPPPNQAAERLFARFLERREAGEPLAFEAWVAGHPEAATDLARLHDRWQELNARLGRLHGPASGQADDAG